MNESQPTFHWNDISIFHPLFGQCINLTLLKWQVYFLPCRSQVFIILHWSDLILLPHLFCVWSVWRMFRNRAVTHMNERKSTYISSTPNQSIFSWLNQLFTVAAKTASLVTLLYESMFWKIFQGEIHIRSKPISVLQIFCESVNNSEVSSWLYLTTGNPTARRG